jgi:uncharacterized membrane protein
LSGEVVTILVRATDFTLPRAVATQMQRGAVQVADCGRGVSSFRVGFMCALRPAGSLQTGQSVRAPIASARNETPSDDRRVNPPLSDFRHRADMARRDVDVPQVRGERRWPAALAILVLIAIPFLLPKQVFPRVLWATAPIEIALLAALAIADPGRIDRRSQLLRWLSIVLTMLLAVIAAVATVLLAIELVDGAPDLKNASTLLTTGALVWLDVNLTFALLYWELDGGGAAERLHDRREYPDLAFPEHLNPRVAPPGWRPIFVDYFYLGFTNATAFSPTDVMPLARWAKMMMVAQALMSIVILALVIANAVNLLQG